MKARAPRRPQRIAIVCPYALSIPGGVQTQVVGLAEELARRDLEVIVVAPGRSHLRSKLPNVTYHLVGRTITVPANGSRAPIAPHLFAVKRSLKALRDFRPDVVHVHEPFVPGPSSAVRRYRDAPVLGTFHRAGAGIVYKSMRPMLRSFADRLAACVAVSDEARSTLRSVLGLEEFPCEVVANAVDADRYAEAPLWPHEQLTVMFCGRHEARKGLAVLLGAFSSLEGSRRLWVVGAGPESAHLRSEFGSDARIEWCGAVGDDELASRLAAADVFVAPSISGESFGVVLLEAMAARTAVLCSDLAGYRLAAGDAAEYFPPADVEALRTKLEMLFSSSARRSELVGLGTDVVERHGFARQTDAYLACYERLV